VRCPGRSCPSTRSRGNEVTIGPKIPLPGILGKWGWGIGSGFSGSVPCPSTTGALSMRVAPGTYLVTASASSGFSSLPQGNFVVVGQIALP
jgi:hypothetical protein